MNPSFLLFVPIIAHEPVEIQAQHLVRKPVRRLGA